MLHRLGSLAQHRWTGSSARRRDNKQARNQVYRLLVDTFPLENLLAFASLAMGGVFERYPGLRVALLESTCGWLPWWLERLDDQ